MKQLFLIPFFAFTLFLFGCSGGNVLPEQVCHYGNVVCDLSNMVCNTGLIPEQICYYIDLSCMNLNYLCQDTLTTEQREIILQTQAEINIKLSKEIQIYKDNIQVKNK